jgi:uncharacterized membrane protein YraQ (UPF0718 family)
MIGAVKRISLRQVFDRSFWIFTALAAATGAACFAVAGEAAFWASFREDAEIFALVMPRLGAALLVAGFIQVLLPRDKVARWIGERSGLRGIALASFAGMLTPGGPMTSFPLVTALHAAGTGRSALVAYLTSWSTLGLQRILAWELPLMGVEFATLRFLASLPLPLVAGLISRLMPAVAIVEPLDVATPPGREEQPLDVARPPGREEQPRRDD